MDGLMDIQMDGWFCHTSGWIDGQIDGWIDVLMDNGYKDGYVSRLVSA